MGPQSELDPGGACQEISGRLNDVTNYKHIDNKIMILQVAVQLERIL